MFIGSDMTIKIGGQVIKELISIKVLEKQTATPDLKEIQLAFAVMDRDDNDMFKLSSLLEGCEIHFQNEVGDHSIKVIHDILEHTIARLTTYSIDNTSGYYQIVSFIGKIDPIKAINDTTQG